jgi:hypothetical protein
MLILNPLLIIFYFNRYADRNQAAYPVRHPTPYGAYPDLHIATDPADTDSFFQNQPNKKGYNLLLEISR